MCTHDRYHLPEMPGSEILFVVLFKVFSIRNYPPVDQNFPEKAFTIINNAMCRAGFTMFLLL